MFIALCLGAFGCKKVENLSEFADISDPAPPGLKDSPMNFFKKDDASAATKPEMKCYSFPGGGHGCGATYEEALAEYERNKKASTPSPQPSPNSLGTQATDGFWDDSLFSNPFGSTTQPEKKVTPIDSKPTPQPLKTDTVPQPAASAFPTVKADADRWWTGDKSQYYLPLQGTTNLFQHYYKSGEKSGYYFDKSTNQLVKADVSAYDAEKKAFDLSKANQIFEMQRLKSSPGWQGIQQNYLDGKLQNAGLSFYYAPTNKNKDEYKYFYEVESDEK